MKHFFFIFIILPLFVYSQKQEKLYINSKDSIVITANNYFISDSAPVIILCHQAGYNKLEYQTIAPKLNSFGFNCIAIDQRSGGVYSNKPNETHNFALRKGLPTNFLDARQDIEAAAEYAIEKYKKPVIIMGSSYSASLALVIASEHKDILAVVAFSPGEYFGEKLKVAKQLNNCTMPVFITGSKDEQKALDEIFSKIKSKEKTIFIPVIHDGKHGASALFADNENAKEYWNELEKFLSKLK
jgi:pimeloyl-ACP methyl ester carboxylesterase